MKKIFSHLLLAAGAMLLSVASYGQTAINSVPYTISQPGYYILAKDLFYPYFYANAITITASNVTLDFAGHVLAGQLGGMPNPPFGAETPNQAVAVAITTSGSNPPSNVTVKNGTITGNSMAINISAPGEGYVVDGMRLESQTYISVNIEGSGCLISNNYISNCPLYGINDGGDWTQIIHNRVVNCFWGIGGNRGYLESNFVANCKVGFACTSTAKLRFNTTVNCPTPIELGILVTDDNN
jgi:hypothetical protein